MVSISDREQHNPNLPSNRATVVLVCRFFEVTLFVAPILLLVENQLNLENPSVDEDSQKIDFSLRDFITVNLLN